MFLKELLEDLNKHERNPVNKMYLHEINMKWDKINDYFEDKKELDFEKIASILDNFSQISQNKKYKYSQSEKKGFKKNSPLFSAIYLNDLVHLLVRKHPIIKKTGIKFGFYKFDTNLKFNPHDFLKMKRQKMLVYNQTSRFLQLTQKIDIQYRVNGKKNFFKYNLYLPIIIFNTYSQLNENDLKKMIYTAEQAQAIQGKARVVLITETLAKGFKPNITGTGINSIFVLRKQSIQKKVNAIAPDVIKNLKIKIDKLLAQKSENIDKQIKQGIIE